MQTCFSLILSLLYIQHIFGVHQHCCSRTQIKMVVPLIRLNQDSLSLSLFIYCNRTLKPVPYFRFRGRLQIAKEIYSHNGINNDF